MRMASDHDKSDNVEPQRHHFGEHWSGSNPIPTIQNFIEHLDRDKRERDQKIDEENRIKAEKRLHVPPEQWSDKESDEQSQEIPKSKLNYRKVTDPTTGREIAVEDMGKEAMDRAKQPRVC